MLTKYEEYLSRATAGFYMQKHFSIQQDTTTNTISTEISGQLIGPVLNIENSYPAGVTGYRLVNGNLISSTTSSPFYLVKKHVFGRYDYAASGPGTYTYYNNPVTTVFSGNTNNQRQLSLFINTGQTVGGSSTVLTINYNDPANQSRTISMPGACNRMTCFNLQTANGLVTDVTSVSRTSGTMNTFGFIELLAFQFLGVFQNLPNVAHNVFYFNNLTLTPTPPLLVLNDELYLYCLGSQTAKGIRGSLSLIGEN